MERTIKDVVDGLLLKIEEYGTIESTVKQYKNVYRSLLKRCNRKEDELYTDQLPAEFLIKARECFDSGIHNYTHNVSIKRAIRLLDEFARTGQPVFDCLCIPKKYIPSSDHQILIEKILEENRLVQDAKIEMDRIMRHFFCFLEDTSIEVSNLNDSILFRFIQLASATKRGTMYRVVRAIRLISEYLKKHHIVKLEADFSMITLKAAPVRVIAPFSHEEIERIIGCIDTGTPLGMRDRAILLLAYETGLRAIDIVKLQRLDIDWKKAEITVIQSKTGELLSLPVNGTVMNAVADYILKARPESDSNEIFLRTKSPYNPFKDSCAHDNIIMKYSTLAGVEKKPFRSFHSLRRSFASGLSAAGVPLPTISQMLGHKSIDEDRPYLSYDREQILFCAMGFNEIPIAGGMYAPTSTRLSSAFLEGGDDK